MCLLSALFWLLSFERRQRFYCGSAVSRHSNLTSDYCAEGYHFVIYETPSRFLIRSFAMNITSHAHSNKPKDHLHFFLLFFFLRNKIQIIIKMFVYFVHCHATYINDKLRHLFGLLLQNFYLEHNIKFEFYGGIKTLTNLHVIINNILFSIGI